MFARGKCTKDDNKLPCGVMYIILLIMQVIWKRLYNCSSKKDAGTLFQMRNLINKRNVVTDPSKRVKSFHPSS